ncbi:hypothetical protein PP636_gp41 [Arthrobacter phage Hestia]|uniref:Uncharacterized protein n=1 Tax=Arthrobacter phage Hestia TaxID=2419609 RepID=A0A3G3M3E6_9CAUD|nr:hypothetical protein PP636_gp41 [Arthrobacter phage Hestia]AYR00932.1 hypothetical protein PBI_HESTIA_54 [Arthrobacter phage Hestia]
MNATAALTAVPSTETFGLPPEASHLIAKLRQMPAEQRATIITNKEPK